MKSLLKFLDFQKKQSGVLTIDDAAEFCNVPRSQVHRWAEKRRVAFVERHGRRYFGRLSLSEWASFTRARASYTANGSLETPDN